MDDNYMKIALCEATKAYEEDEVPIGAVVVKEGIIISRAHNMREALNDPTAHAEIIALKEAAKVLRSWRLTGCELYVTIEPCAMCAGAIVLARIKRLIYGAEDIKAGACGSIMDVINNPYLNHKVDITKGVLRDECSYKMRDYFRQKRK